MMVIVDVDVGACHRGGPAHVKVPRGAERDLGGARARAKAKARARARAGLRTLELHSHLDEV